MKPNLFFILGAPDPEMRAIEAVLRAQDLPYGYAAIAAERVQASQAYDADNVIAQETGRAAVGLLDRDLVFVESRVQGLSAARVIDHHHPGDPGFGVPPERYVEGASLGQLLAFLGLQPTQEQLVICAGDHCLSHAYRGACPGVTPEDLATWRAKDRAEFQGLTLEEIEGRIEAAVQVLRQTSKVEIAGQPVAWVEDAYVPEVREASARFGIPVMFIARDRRGRRKACIRGAEPEVIAEWMATCGLDGVYGDPVRGYAGGYA